MKRLALLLTALSALALSSAHAGVTGKIAGSVTDKESGEPLAGVNIMIEGSNLGAASDAEGHFTILNVPPGTYTLRVRMIGYTTAVVRSVVVNINQTTRVQVALQAEVLGMDEVTIVAERPAVTPDVSASEMHIKSEEIAALPLKTVDQVLVLQAGIEQGSEGVIIRGGGPRQTGFLVDGMALNDERSNIPFTALSLNAIKEITVQTGGFNAEYGNIRSGLINVISREGDEQKYSGGLTIQYRPAAPKNFGPSLLDPNSYFIRPYLDPAVAWTGTSNGAWDDYTRRQYPTFEGWNAVSEALLADNDPTNDLTPTGAQRLWLWQHRRQLDIDKPDYVIDAGFGGPVPVLGKKLGSARFFLSHFRQREMFIFPLSRDSYSDNSTQLKITSNISDNIKLNITGLYGEVHSVSPYNWTTTPTGRVLRTSSEVANLVNSSSGNSILFMPGYFSPSSVYRTFAGFTLTHMLNSKTFYTLSLQHNINRYSTFKMADRDTSKVFEPVPGFFTDEAPFGYYGYGVSGIDGMSIGGWMNIGRDRSVISTTKFRADYTSQLNSVNQIKTGIEIVYNDYNIKSFAENPSMSTWNREQVYRRFPFRLGVYLQDKLEFRGFIANVGLRLDYSDANGIRFDLTPYDDLFREGFGNNIESEAPKAQAKPDWYLSPRLGVAHPITENSKFYFNYGHFTQEPSSTFRFRLQRESNGLVTSIGNPDLRYERTVAYELGYEHNLYNAWLLTLAAYYKDISNQPGWIYYESLNAAVQYNIPENNNYEDIRGFELTLNKRLGTWISGFVNYTYEVRTSGYFGLRRYYQDPNKQRDYVRQNPYQARPRPQPYARANIVLRTPDDFGPTVAGHALFGDWNISLLANWKAGAYATYNPKNIPGVVDNVRWKDRYSFDLRASKTFSLRSYQIHFYLDIINLFNTRYLNFAGFANIFDYYDYLESLRLPWEEGAQKGNDKIGDVRPDGVAYEPYDPTDPSKSEADLQRILDTKAYIDMPNFRALTFLNPRDITFGIRINF